MVYNNSGFSSWFALSLALALSFGKGNALFAQEGNAPLKWEKNALHYTPDSLGNRIPDFSYAGYKAGAAGIPNVPVKAVVPLIKGDATASIQAALDYVAGLQPDQTGFRGAVLLKAGTYEVLGSLKINASGIVLRGSGVSERGTVLLGAGKDRATLIQVVGLRDSVGRAKAQVATAYVPVNAMSLEVGPANAFHVGDHVTIHRPSTQEWVKELGADHFGGGITALAWKAGQRDIFWDRQITKIEGAKIYLDAPLTTALDTHYGKSVVTAYEWKGRIEQVGIENLTLRSSYDESNPKDEAHRWMAIALNNVRDGWVRQVNFQHFAGSAVYIDETGSRITVEDCKSTQPISEIGGQRRYTYFTSGQQTLFQHVYAEEGYHDFAVGFMAPGPTVFLECQSERAYSYSGAIDSWASGVLFDGVRMDAQALRFQNLEQDANGAGWAAANSVFWQCSAAMVTCYQPPTAQNWAFGTWAQFAGNGYWDQSNEHIHPQSLYYAQLKERLGEQAEKWTSLMPEETEASSSPTEEEADRLTKLSVGPAFTIADFIDQAPKRRVIPVDGGNAKVIQEQLVRSNPKAPVAIRLENGWLMGKNGVLVGRRQDIQWWNGSSRRYALEKSRPHITRFVPGQIGTGLTDDIVEVVDTLTKNHVAAFEHNYGLWYERRRDDHERIRRMNGEVWPPFYELPFARSGQSTAWDGLSKYDLTKYNTWYWMRLKQFADLAEQQDVLLVHQNYFQHNIIEAGAHYADFPWRSANNINQTGFPEPPPYAGDKRIFLSEQFYDLSNAHRKELHRAYIRQCLDNFKENKGVLQLIGAEFTGPLHFVDFWLDMIQEWEQEHQQRELVGLSTTKDVQDAILADKSRNGVVDVIDIRYWFRQDDGTDYAPKGGKHLAPRQQARQFKPKKTSFEQVYQIIQEYKKQFPEKAVMYSAAGMEEYGWAIFMAGGSLANLPAALSPDLLKAAGTMRPADGSQGLYILKGAGANAIYYARAAKSISLDLTPQKGSMRLRWIDPKTGKMVKEENVKGGKSLVVSNPLNGDAVAWIFEG